MIRSLLIASLSVFMFACGPDESEPAEVDCAGIAGGNAIEDACGVCDGDGTSCLDCAGVPNGDAIEDACGVCAGDGSSCADCAGVPNGDSVEDVCGICDGDGTSCLDCAGVVNGASVEDACGVCDGDGSSCADCAGVPNGDAIEDVCGVCAGDGSSCADCAGVPNGDAVEDACGVCAGDGSSCADCAGVPNGDSVEDVCGICDGDGTSCLDCAGVVNGASVEDACGVCDGDGSSCADCAGVPNGDAVEDVCGVCDGDGTSCLDCAGVVNGTSVEDACGLCDGDGLSCIECPDGEVPDACGVCDGDGSSCAPPEGFVLIEAGTFTMGSPPGEPGRGGYETQHEVTLTSGFYMSDHEITQAEWQALIDNNPSSANNGTCPTCPVESVNWWEALLYSNALSESEGLTACYVPSGCTGSAGSDLNCTGVTLQDGSGNAVTTPHQCEGYRLPTEAEWEYAARAGTTTALYSGDITVPGGPDPNADAIGWYNSNANPYLPKAVRGKLPNAWGLYDMSGNVWEWTWDWMDDYPAGPVTNPTGPEQGLFRIIRGGGVGSSASDLRSAYRLNFEPDTRVYLIGFRLARSR